jgi:hypothetical protein
MIMPRDLAGQDYNIQIVNKSFDNVAKFETLGTKLTHQKLLS